MFNPWKLHYHIIILQLRDAVKSKLTVTGGMKTLTEETTGIPRYLR